ncbi:MAG TPA: alpha/beta hydrolase [Acetobacteraceae bacterium]|nr:alpha/beta hydrolase [Acetobacteraceae bacterium]
MPRTSDAGQPACLLIPGRDHPRRNDWQSAWIRERDDCIGIDFGSLHDPIRSVWLSRIDQAVGMARSRVVLVEHDLGCLAVAWWAALLDKRAARRVIGALLVAPPDPDAPDSDDRVRRFGPLPEAMLPFPAILVASRDDPNATIERSRAMAAEWVTDFFDAGSLGHLDARSHLNAWPDGQRLLDILIDGGPGLSRYTYRRPPPPRPASRPVHRMTPSSQP